MEKLENFVNLVTSKMNVDNEKIRTIQNLYGKPFAITVCPLLSSFKDEPTFFEGLQNIRLLSWQEVLNADKDLGTTFVEDMLVPVFDLGDNDYLAYDIANHLFVKYNIAENVRFSSYKNLKEALKKYI